MARKKPNTRYETSHWGRAVPYTSPTGVKTYLYNIGTAAEAIARTSQTIRRWEISGIIPLTPFKVGGKRMYSDQHIDALVECAERFHIRPGVKIQDTQFSTYMYKKYEEIYNLFFVENTNKEEVNNGKDGKEIPKLKKASGK